MVEVPMVFRLVPGRDHEGVVLYYALRLALISRAW